MSEVAADLDDIEARLKGEKRGGFYDTVRRTPRRTL